MSETETPSIPRPTVSGICHCNRCDTGLPPSIYRMISSCYNCHTEVLMLFRVGDQTSVLDCPICGCKDVHSKRLATDDEASGA